MTTTDILITTPMRAASSNTPPVFTVPARSCDSHFHVFEPDYPHVPNPLYTFPDGTVDQYLALCDFLGIERMVLVQPTFYGLDNRLTLDAMARIGSRCRAVIRVEEDVSDAELDRMHKLGVRALRLDLFARREQPIEDIIAYIKRMATRTTPRGWHLQFYTPGTVVRDLLPFLADFDHTYVIDHMGYMLEAEGLTQSDFERLLGVLKHGYCWIKLSGAYRIAKKHPLGLRGPARQSAGSYPPGPPYLGFRLAASSRRSKRLRRNPEPACRLGARRSGSSPDSRRWPANTFLRRLNFVALQFKRQERLLDELIFSRFTSGFTPPALVP